MGATEIIPKLEFESSLETALATSDGIARELHLLTHKAIEIQVTDYDSYTAIGAVLSETRSIKKNRVAALWAPFFGVVDRVKDFLKVHRSAIDNVCEKIDNICVAKMKEYERKELEAAKAEEAKLNKKAAEPVTVKPAIPSVTGYRRSTVYRAEVVDPKKFFYRYRVSNGSKRAFLEQFLVIDEKALAAYYRENHDNKDLPPHHFAHSFPGVRFWTE